MCLKLSPWAGCRLPVAARSWQAFISSVIVGHAIRLIVLLGRQLLVDLRGGRRRSAKPMTNMVRTSLCACLLILAACRPAWKRELWIIPRDYVGWLRLDYSVTDQPALPVENGRYIVRMPATGRMQTSSMNTASIDTNEYAVEDSTGRHRLESFSPTLIPPRYGIQIAYWVGRVSGNKPEAQFRCVFVGTLSDFRTNGRRCDAWQLGQPQPPK